MWNFTSNTGLAGPLPVLSSPWREPPSLAGHAAPYYLPFRALTVDTAPNVLTAGKTMAMSFAANTALPAPSPQTLEHGFRARAEIGFVRWEAAREHPDEFNAGVAAGAAAALMVQHGWTTEKVDVAALQGLLASPGIGQPLSW
jgi:hypothetical protein